MGAGPANLPDGRRGVRETALALLLRANGGVRPVLRTLALIAFAVALIAIAAGLSLLVPKSPAMAAVFLLPGILAATLLGGWRNAVSSWAAAVLAFWWLTRAPAGDTLVTVAVFSVAAALQAALAVGVHDFLLDSGRLRQRLLSLVAAAQGFVLYLDGDGKPIEHNPRWTELTGMPWSEYRETGWIGAVHPEDRPLLPFGGETPDKPYVHIELRLRETGGDWRWHRMRAVPIRRRDGTIREWVSTIRDIEERKRAAEQREIVLREARHRLKNLMAIIEALAKYSAPRPGTSPDVDAFLNRFSGRLHALTAASDLVLATSYRAIESRALIDAILAPFMGGPPARIEVEGPVLNLSEEFGGGLAMALHELATNAIKHGALSVPQGRIALRWGVETTAEGERVMFEWKEHDGPPCEKPAKESFGMRMIRSTTAREDTGAVILDYEPDGLRCRISYVRKAEKPA